MFVYPTQACSGSKQLIPANAQTDANHMMGHAELERAPPETVCVHVCVCVTECLYVCYLASVWQNEVCNATKKR